MKTDFVWAKTLLSVYRYLERITGAIDKIILRSGLNSANICGQNFFQNNILTVTQKIIDLSERKVTLINLKILIDDTLKSIDQESAEFLIEKYFDGAKARELVERHEISIRTVFRKLDAAVKSFAIGLSKKGYPDFRLASMLENEEWILNVYRTLLNGNEEQVVLSKINLARAVS